ncbi:OmpA family protein [Spongiivirga sp. MCCC 1A20706]|uniref:OmpA family protein n=1 Tax=Spongiivirga sp. MCCC 1A20706 TaxID=3160963 RepID=UPI00397792DA
MKKYISLLLVVLSTGQLIAQSSKVEKGDRSYKAYDYQKAIDLYKDQVEGEVGTENEVIEKIANAYYFNADFVNAEEWYRKLTSNASVDVNPEAYYRFSQSLKANKKYSEADKWMDTFIKSKPADSRGKRFVEIRNYLEKIAENSGRFTIESQSFNTKFNDFGPSFYGDKLLFSSGRALIGFQVKKHLWNNASLYDIYEVSQELTDTLGKKRKIKKLKEINTKLHESTSVVTKDGSTMYFTRNNLYKGEVGKDTIGNILLKLFKATKNDRGKWDNIMPLPFNGETFSTGHPALSDDEKTLYFTSDRPGGIGAADIYRVAIKGDSYGDIENLGPTVNTEGRESFPFLTKSNKLFFASDGFYGLGGLDVFMVDVNTLDTTSDTKLVYNVGEPINSPKDDFGFIINEDTNKGYVASNRAGGMGGDDIYGFTRTKMLVTKCDGGISGLAFETHFQKPLPGATLVLKNSEGEEIATTVSDSQGKFTFDASCANEDYVIEGTKAGHEKGTTSCSLTVAESTKEVQVDLLELPPYEGDDVAKILNLRPIYFSLNKSFIRKSEEPELTKVLNYMRENPTVKIEIRSHTDSRGSDPYNLKLSDRRAKSTAQWIIDQGIAADRISGKGFGETQLKNECKNGVRCSDAKHEENRRSEFIIVSK